MTEGSKSARKRRGVLARLRHDTRGNTLAIMAASLMPLLGFAGCAIDAARLAATKSRLQQACDAGVLAGRKAMLDASTSNTVLDTAATDQANSFFKNNFQAGWYSTQSVSFTPSKTSDAQVAGVASATLPMTVLSIFGVSPKVINVQCRAEFDIADTDILFVLDTTGSMACLPSESETVCSNYVNAKTTGTVAYSRPTDAVGGNSSMAGYPGTTAYYVPEKAGSRISALRTAVLKFYDTMKANVDSTTHVRYGFVTYTSTVNAGRAITDISPSYMIGGAGNGTTTANYQTRVPNGETSSSSSQTTTKISQADCNKNAYSKTYTSADTAKSATVSWTSGSKGTCVTTTTTTVQKWSYKQAPQNVAAFVAGSTVPDPTKLRGETARWTGCIEERDTKSGISTFTTSSLPADLDSSLIPTTDGTRWRPMWPELIYARSSFNSTSTINATGDTTSPNASPNMGNPAETYFTKGYITCGKPVQRLREMTRDAVSTYVNAPDFRAIGGTYHDTGMIWGTRMLDPTGIFRNDTAPWTGRAAPNRVIVFLTDGDMAPNTWIYGMYGVEYYDKRIANDDTNNLKNYHNKRFLAECAKARSLRIDVWTVTIGPAATTEMQSCASSINQALYTSSGDDLAVTFATIAKQVAMLRITQ